MSIRKIASNSILLRLSVIVSALGFFVDVYDLLLFAIIRKPSLAALGLSPDQILTEGEKLISIQMAGMLLGGILFGILGDKKGRLKVLFGSILLYSIANILNGLVTSVPQYAILRFIAGIGLAGELGAGVTLVSEQLPKEKRSMAAGFIAGFGLFGAVFAFGISKLVDWRTCYIIGGILGFFLLAMRLQVKESSLFEQVKSSQYIRGNFIMFFNNRARFIKYIQCILIGLPTWYIIGILITFSDQFGKAFGIENIDPGKSVMYFYISLAIGDFLVGYLAEKLKSRKKTLYIFYAITLLFSFLFFSQAGGNASYFYFIVCGLGIGLGFNVIYLTLAIEQFGTNLRASAAISIPNMIRGSVPLIIILFQYLRLQLNDYATGAWVTGIILFIPGMIAAIPIEETYGKELDFNEEN